MGTREISGRISDSVDGDQRAESEEQTDCGQSVARADAHECCRSCQSASRKSEPHSIRQAKTGLCSFGQTFDSRARKAKKTCGCPGLISSFKASHRPAGSSGCRKAGCKSELWE